MVAQPLMAHEEKADLMAGSNICYVVWLGPIVENVANL